MAGYNNSLLVSFILSCRVSISMLFGLAYLAHPAFALASGISYANSENLWCHINPNMELPGNSGASVELSKSDIYVVKKEAQAEAQRHLQTKAFIALTGDDVVGLVGQLPTANGKSHFYLVRASAIYDGDTNFKSTFKFAASFYPDTLTLNIYSFGLRHPETMPTNLALVVKTPSLIKAANAICETAS